jgi:UDP-glucose 4-epimerase
MLAAGWRPRYTDLAEIVESAWKWKQANADRLQARQG